MIKNFIYNVTIEEGVKFIGTIVKKDRKYTGNLTRGNIVKTIHHFNVVYATYKAAEKFCCVITLTSVL